MCTNFHNNGTNAWYLPVRFGQKEGYGSKHLTRWRDNHRMRPIIPHLAVSAWRGCAQAHRSRTPNSPCRGGPWNWRHADCDCVHPPTRLFGVSVCMRLFVLGSSRFEKTVEKYYHPLRSFVQSTWSVPPVPLSECRQREKIDRKSGSGSDLFSVFTKRQKTSQLATISHRCIRPAGFCPDREDRK